MDTDLQYLFAYGTLKSDKPEHAQHCARPLSIMKAKAPGSLWRLREGYPILQVDPTIALRNATRDTANDWREATVAARSTTPPAHEGSWIEGELFAYPLTTDALQRMDDWENFVPGIPSPYQRRVIWLKDETGAHRIAWAYVCYTPPNWATLLSETSW